MLHFAKECIVVNRIIITNDLFQVVETLSSDNVLPHGTGVRFDIDDYLESVTPDMDMPEVEENTQERLA